MSRFSIIVPTYNCAHFLSETLESILGQSEERFEVIVIDDGSTDSTLQVARQFADRDARIRVIAGAHSGKPAIARNLGLRAVRGDLVTFLDGDDLYLPERLASVGKVFDQCPSLDVAFHDVYLIGESGERFQGTFLSENDYLQRAGPHLTPLGDTTFACRESFYGFMSTEIAGIHTSAITVRASALANQQELFPEDLTLMEDYDLWFRLVLAGQTAFLNEPLSCYRNYGNSISSRKSQLALDQLAAHKRNFARGRARLSSGQRMTYRRRIANMQAEIGYRAFKAEDSAYARTAYWRSLVIWPLPWVALALAKTLVPSSLRRLIKPSEAQRKQ